MMPGAAVSVIIPVYNGEEFLERCLDSVFAQTLKSVQVICVNDGSTDGSADILACYQQRYPDMVVITQDNGGLSAARNAGLTKVCGEYVDFLDCDDWLQADALERLYTRAKRDSLDMLFYDGETIYENDRLRRAFPAYETLYKTKVKVKKPVATGEELFVQLVEGRSYRASACMYLLRMAHLRQTGLSFLPGIYYEDNVFTLQCLLCARRAGVDATPYYKRSMRESSIVTAQKDFRHVRSYYICQNTLQQFLLMHPFHADTIRCAQQQVSSLMTHAKQTYAALPLESREAALKKYPEAHMIDAMLRMGGIAFSPSAPAEEQTPVPEQPWMNKATLRKYAKCPYQQEHPFVSVILPMYNAADLLEETLHDLQQQSLQNFEMIFVDDGSADSSCEVVEKYAKGDGRIRLLRQKNQYAGVARNTGMTHAKGDYLIFLDADDRFDANLLLHAYACARENEAQVVLFHADLLQMPQGTYAPANFLCPCKRLPQQVFSGKEGADHIFDVLNPWTKLFSRTYIQQLNIQFQPLFSSNDLYFSMVAMACAQRIAPLPQVLVHYRIGQTNNIQSQKSKAPLDTYHAFAAVKEELLVRGIFETFRKPFAVKAAESMLRSLDTMTTLEGYRTLYQKLHDGGMTYLEVEAVAPEDMRHISGGEAILSRCCMIKEMTYDAYVLQMLSHQGNEKKREAGAAALAQRTAELQEEVQALRNSHSYKVGNLIMQVPYKIKTAIKAHK